MPGKLVRATIPICPDCGDMFACDCRPEYWYTREEWVQRGRSEPSENTGQLDPDCDSCDKRIEYEKSYEYQRVELDKAIGVWQDQFHKECDRTRRYIRACKRMHREWRRDYGALQTAIQRGLKAGCEINDLQSDLAKANARIEELDGNARAGVKLGAELLIGREDARAEVATLSTLATELQDRLDVTSKANERLTGLAQERGGEVETLKEDLRLFMPELTDALRGHLQPGRPGQRPDHKIAVAIRVLKEQGAEIERLKQSRGFARAGRDEFKADNRRLRDGIEEAWLNGNCSLDKRQEHLRALLDEPQEGDDPRHNTCVDCGRTKNSIGGGTRRVKGEEWHCLGGCKPDPDPPRCEHPGDCGECNACVAKSKPDPTPVPCSRCGAQPTTHPISGRSYCSWGGCPENAKPFSTLAAWNKHHSEAKAGASDDLPACYKADDDTHADCEYFATNDNGCVNCTHAEAVYPAPLTSLQEARHAYGIIEPKNCIIGYILDHLEKERG